MPIYEYVCTGCGAEIEVIQRFSDPPLTACESCSGPLQKKISPSAFHLKGSGWYVTDYARKSSGESGKNGDSKPAADTTKADSKPVESTSTSTETVTKTETKSVTRQDS